MPPVSFAYALLLQLHLSGIHAKMEQEIVYVHSADLETLSAYATLLYDQLPDDSFFVRELDLATHALN